MNAGGHRENRYGPESCAPGDRYPGENHAPGDRYPGPADPGDRRGRNRPEAQMSILEEQMSLLED